MDDHYEFAPLEAARRFLEARSVAYDVGAKNYRVRDEATSTWLSLGGNALKRVMKQRMVERYGHDVTAATLKK